MESGARMNSMPPAPIFGVVGGGEGNGGGLGNSKFINIDEIFSGCFLDDEANDLLGLDQGVGAGASPTSPAGGSGGGGVGVGAGAEDGDGLTPPPGGAHASGAGVGGVGVGELIPATFGVPPMVGAATPTAMMQAQARQQQQLGVGGLSVFMGGGASAAGSQAVVAGKGGDIVVGGIGGIPPAGAAGAGAVAGRGRAPGGRGYGAGGGRGGRGATGGGAAYGMRAAGTTAPLSSSQAGLDDDDEEERGGKRGGVGGTAGGKRPRQGGRNMTEQQRLDRRERNREHAKRSRVRKKFLLESLQKSVTALQEENEKLRGAIRANLGEDEAKELLAQTDSSSLIASSPGDATKVLDDPDYSLVKALQTAQQNFVITDPTLPDNPIVFASQGFLELTGYTLDQVLGRNCRFLQGPDTDPKAVEKIRKAIEKGMDTSVCLRNYRVDGAMFWNQFFIAALRDSEGAVINYVGVQCRVDEDFVRAVQQREGEEGEGEGDEDDEEEEDRSDAEEKDAAG